MPNKSPPTVQVGPWPKGIDNRSPDHAVPGEAVRNAVNVNLARSGQARRRSGYMQLYAANGTHSLWSCELGTYFVEQGVLKFFPVDRELAGSPVPDVLLTGLSGGVAFEFFNGDVYLSDNYSTWILRGGTVPTPWGIPAPARAPVLDVAGGTLPAGDYLAAFSFVAADGREGPLSALTAMTTSATGGIRLTGFPSVPGDMVAAFRLYLSGPGSSTLYNVADVSIGVEEYVVTERSDTGSVADIRTLTAPPVASIIRHHRGRMFLASGSVVYFTEPLALHLVDAVKNFWQFPEAISIMEPVEAGMFIVADKTYFAAFTDPDEAKLLALQPDKGVPGTSQRIPTGEGVIWYGDRGVMYGTQDGRVEAVQEELVAADKARKGAALLRDNDGLRQYIASLQSPELSGLAANSFMEAEIIRRGGQNG